MDTTTDPTAALKLAREALLSLLADSPRPYDEMLGRQALAALDALPSARSGRPCAAADGCRGT